jgi:hypothetical protein
MDMAVNPLVQRSVLECDAASLGQLISTFLTIRSITFKYFDIREENLPFS